MRRTVLLLLAVLLLAVAGFETWRAWSFYHDLRVSRSALLSLRDDLSLDTLEASEPEVLDIQSRLRDASARLDSARSFVHNDPFVLAAGLLPVAGRNADGLQRLVEAASASADTGLAATEVLLDFRRDQGTAGQTSIQNAIAFLQSQEAHMAAVRSGLDRVQASDSRIPGGLVGPLAKAHSDLKDAIGRLEGLVRGYERADRLLPAMLGYDGPRTYLVLPQNDTELFPSGGLMSSYGLATFDHGSLGTVQFEYFVNLFDRWQKTSGGEYVAPPAPLRNYLLHDVSWALGEAGWYPDFPTTVQIANSFVTKGGVPPTDGTIAIDMQFVQALLEYLGPVHVQAYDVTVDAANLSEVTLEQTRTESSIPGSPGKAFLSALGQDLLARIFATPRDKWVGLLKVLDRTARERHLQLHFADPSLQALGSQYSLDGAMVKPDGDYLMVADASVQSTKLNLILETSIALDLQLAANGTAFARVGYQVTNPFPDWQQGRDSAMVRALMLNGVYGSYLRVYADPRAVLRQAWLNGAPAGVEQAGPEVGKMAFGRFTPVLPGETRRVDFLYTTPGMVRRDGDDYAYSLYIQKEPGTAATPLNLRLQLPEGARDVRLSLDGKPLAGASSIDTDLRTDRVISVRFRLG